MNGARDSPNWKKRWSIHSYLLPGHLEKIRRTESLAYKMSASEIRTVQTIVGATAHSNQTVSKLRVIALNTFRESVRDRVLYNLILFVLILVGSSVFIGELSVYQESKFTATIA